VKDTYERQDVIAARQVLKEEITGHEPEAAFEPGHACSFVDERCHRRQVEDVGAERMVIA
jgi:hypothetical protein